MLKHLGRFAGRKKTGKSTVKLLRTYASLVNQNTESICDDYEGWTFADFEANPVPKNLKKCVMSAFGLNTSFDVFNLLLNDH